MGRRLPRVPDDGGGEPAVTAENFHVGHGPARGDGAALGFAAAIKMRKRLLRDA